MREDGHVEVVADGDVHREVVGALKDARAFLHLTARPFSDVTFLVDLGAAVLPSPGYLDTRA